MLLVDAVNAFNNLNRQVALHNIRYICPAVATLLINCYRSHSSLFVGGTEMLFQEGTTQRDPLAMTKFGLATVPLIKEIATQGATQAWFADDAGCGGRILKYGGGGISCVTVDQNAATIRTHPKHFW